MQLPKKVVKPLSDKELPEPFKSYWLGDDSIDRNWKFFLVEGELYIQDNEFDEEDKLLTHWTMTNCVGVSNFIEEESIPVRRDLPFVRTNGEFLFLIVQSDSYETSAISPLDGKQFVVHEG